MKEAWFRVALILAVACLATRAHAAPAAKYHIRWLLGHPNIDYFEEAAASFKKTVEEKSNGEIEVSVETAQNPWEDTGKGLPGPEIAAEVAGGQAEMGHSFTDVMGSMDHRLWVFDLPFLFRNYHHQELVFEGPIGNDLLNGLDAHGLKGLAFTYSGGANMISSRNHPVLRPEDLRGLRIAVFGSPVEQSWLTALGAVPVSVGHHEEGIAPLAARGAVDAAILTWRRQQRVDGLSTELNYGSAEGVSYLVSVTYINKRFFDSLPPRYRTLLESASRDAARIERSRTIELNARSKRRLLAEGGNPMHSMDLSKADLLLFQDALKPIYGKSLDALVGKGLIDRIRRTGAPEDRTSRLADNAAR